MTNIFMLFCVFTKMLFRPAIRWQLIALIAGFLLMIFFNAYFNINDYNEICQEEVEIQSETAYKVYFFYIEDIPDYYKFKKLLSKNKPDEYVIMHNNFILRRRYLVVDLKPDTLFNYRYDNLYRKANRELNSLFNLGDYIFALDTLKSEHYFFPNMFYITPVYNENIPAGEKDEVRRELIDIITTIDTVGYKGQYNTHLNSIGFSTTTCCSVSQYFTNIDVIVPKYFFDIRTRLLNNYSASPYFDPHEMFPILTDTMMITDSFFLYDTTTRDKFLWKKINDFMVLDSIEFYNLYDTKIFARHIPVYIPRPTIYTKGSSFWGIKTLTTSSIIDSLINIRNKGFSFLNHTKIIGLKEKVRMLSENKEKTIKMFLIIDFVASLTFMFMISFFTFIYLKREIAFLLSHKDFILELIGVFWIFPLLIVLIFKTVLILSLHTLYPLIPCFVISYILLLAISYLLVKLAFKDFQGQEIKLYKIYSGS